MKRARIFIDGEAGTTGLEIRSRLEVRQDIEIVKIEHEKRKDTAVRKALLNDVDLAVLCLPDESAREAVSLVENPDVRILDASTAHRVASEWVYGFPELSEEQSEKIRYSRRVSNPGCYATGALALLAPLIRNGIIFPDSPITITGVSGYSGGGRQMIDDYEGDNAADSNPYRIYALELAHKHLPEITLHAGLVRKPLFIPAVGKYRQGMLVTIPLNLWNLPGCPDREIIHMVLTNHYLGSDFISVIPIADMPATLDPEGLNGSNMMEIYVFGNSKEKTVLLVARLDNLGKGASGAAVQNINLMLSLDA